MSLLFSNLVKQALTTFERTNIGSLKSNFHSLKQIIDQISVSDINLDLNLISEEQFKKFGKAPCTFVHVFQNDNVAMSVFILQGGYTMPLHDHPMMNGLLKAISGTLLIQSYTKHYDDENDDKIYDPYCEQLKVIVEPESIINSETDGVYLTPREKNFHEITAVNGVAAFFDILSPPYETVIPIYGERQCNFYRKLLPKINQSELIQPKPMDIIQIEKIPSPSSYYCDTGNYQQPEFLFEYGDTYRE